MKHDRLMAVLLVSACLLALQSAGMSQEAGKTWAASPFASVEGLHVPECVRPEPAAGVAYIANIESVPDAYWNDDGKGYIARISSEGKMQVLRLVESRPDAVINAPKGMAILDGWLYFTDNARLMRVLLKDVEKGAKPEQIVLPEAQRLNDLASDGKTVYVSDTALGVVYAVAPGTPARRIPAPASANGLACDKGLLFAVSWDLHEVYELDPAGKAEPKPFGVAQHFTGLDGIEVLEDGSFIVSDFLGNKVSVVRPDRKTVYTLAELESPADIGLDRTHGLLYVPSFMKDRVEIFKLTAK